MEHSRREGGEAIGAHRGADAELPKLSESAFRRIVEQSVDAITVNDHASGAFLLVNREFERLTGHRGREIAGRKPVEIGLWSSRRDLRDVVDALRTRGAVRGLEVEFRARDGRLIPALFSAFRMEAEAGEVVVAFVRDLTDRRRAELELRASEERFRALCTDAPVGIFRTDAAGRCSYTNDQLLETAGLTAEQALGDGWARVLHPDDRERVLGSWSEAARAGRGLAVDFRWLRPAGDVRWVHSEATAMRGESGEVLGFVGTITDITERRRAEEERDRFFVLSRDLHAVAGFDGWFKRLNPAWERLLGWTHAELFARPFLEVVHPDDRAGVAGEVSRLSGGGPTISFEIRIRTARGEWLPVLWNAEPVVEERVFYAVGRDISELRSSARLREQLVAMMSHDIKSPLAAAIGYVDLLREVHAPQSEEADFLDRIEASARTAVTLATNFVDVSQIQDGALALQRAPAALNDVVRRVASDQESRARTRRIAVELDLDPALPTVSLDEPLFARVLTNLLSNALAYSPAGAAIEVRTWCAGGEVSVSVRDRGPGIPEDQRRSLFTRFGRGGGRRADSTGLGLFIVKTVTDAHGGRVEVDCPPDGGSVFTLSLPLEAVG